MGKLLERSNKTVVVFGIQGSIEKGRAGCQDSRPALVHNSSTNLDIVEEWVIYKE
jgi:hypothetical protein